MSARTLVVGYYAAAADAAGRDSETLETAATTVGELSAEIEARHGDTMAAILGVSAFLVGDELVRDPATPLGESAAVDVLPPFAGG